MNLQQIGSTLLIVAGLGACGHFDGTDPGTNPVMESTPQTLAAYHWTLDRAVDAAGESDPQWIRNNNPEPVRLTFQEQRLGVTGLCNSMGASYKTDGSKISIDHVVSTMMMCPDESLMRYEHTFGQRLEHASAWHITRMHDEPETEPSLTLRFRDGAQWVLKGTPTPETQYGSTGEIVFLEVAAQRQPCSHPLIENKQCLYTRTIEYDAQGLKQSQGSWEYFYDEIENYEHTPGVRNVLRVKRYTRQDVPADASRYAYVLDMIVESERQQ